MASEMAKETVQACRDNTREKRHVDERHADKRQKKNNAGTASRRRPRNRKENKKRDKKAPGETAAASSASRPRGLEKRQIE